MNENPYGDFFITQQGLDLITKWGTGVARVIDSVWVGSGKVPSGTNPSLLTDLVAAVAQATTTKPVTVRNQIQFVVEYRNDMNPMVDGFWLQEYGIFAFDPDVGRVLLGYGTLGDFPERVPSLSSQAVVRRYPVAIAVSTSGEIVLNYYANAFMTAEEVSAYLANYFMAYSGIEFNDHEDAQDDTVLHLRITQEVAEWPPGGGFYAPEESGQEPLEP